MIQWGYKAQRFYNRFRKPLTLGSRALVVREDHVLLVRLTYQKGWFLPGGGVDKGETFYSAVLRELGEECGIQSENPRLFGIYLNRKEHKVDHVAVYVVDKFSGEPRCQDADEIAEVQFFPMDNLPRDIWQGHRRRIEEYTGKRAIEHVW